MINEHRRLLSRDERFLRGLPVGYLSLQADGRVAYVNAFLASVLGRSADEMLGHAAGDYAYDESSLELIKEQLQRGAEGRVGSYAVYLKTANGERVAVSFFGVPEYGDDGTFWGSRCIVVPFSEVERHSSVLRERAVAGPSAPMSGVNSLQIERVLSELTRRERDVVELLRSGLRVQGVAECLSLSHYTVRNHLKRIFRKMGVASQGELLMKLNRPLSARREAAERAAARSSEAQN